jgi:hypothetical protein
VAAVEQFLASDKHIHIMRDHPAHVAYMMGGTWGAKVDKERLNFFTAFKKLFQVKTFFPFLTFGNFFYPNLYV